MRAYSFVRVKAVHHGYELILQGLYGSYQSADQESEFCLGIKAELGITSYDLTLEDSTIWVV